jgi:hypothetical protein
VSWTSSSSRPSSCAILTEIAPWSVNFSAFEMRV